MIPVSVPRFELAHRSKLANVGVVCRCSSCNGPVFLKYGINTLSNPVVLDNRYEQVVRPVETFEMKYLAGSVSEDFQEAPNCFSHSCWNAFGAMCRRCVQSVAMDFGVDGTNKVQQQVAELEKLGVTDAETMEQLRAIILTGHDRAHPHLPSLSEARAGVLLQLMKDVLYQIYARPAKIREASELRKRAISK